MLYDHAFDDEGAPDEFWDEVADPAEDTIYQLKLGAEDYIGRRGYQDSVEGTAAWVADCLHHQLDPFQIEADLRKRKVHLDRLEKLVGFVVRFGRYQEGALSDWYDFFPFTVSMEKWAFEGIGWTLFVFGRKIDSRY